MSILLVDLSCMWSIPNAAQSALQWSILRIKWSICDRCTSNPLWYFGNIILIFLVRLDVDVLPDWMPGGRRPASSTATVGVLAWWKAGLVGSITYFNIHLVLIFSTLLFQQNLYLLQTSSHYSSVTSLYVRACTLSMRAFPQLLPKILFLTHGVLNIRTFNSSLNNSVTFTFICIYIYIYIYICTYWRGVCSSSVSF